MKKKYLILILIMSATLNACKNSGTTPEVKYSGEDLSGFAEITRDKQTKKASITINQNEEWKLYAGPSVEEIDLRTPLLFGHEKGTFHLNVPDSVRSYFLLQTDKGTAIMVERHLPMTGGFNFRDLGGIKNKDGKYTKWGKIFRSDDLHSLTQADLKYLAAIPIVSVVDFRSEGEMSSAPDKLPPHAQYVANSINPGNLNDAASGLSSLSDLKNMNMDSIMSQINIMMVTDDESIGRFRNYFALLQNPDKVPVMFHCSAGKDRTGMAAALTLFALGVDEERIMEDYLLSNEYIVEKYSQYIDAYPELKPLFTVKSSFLGAGIEQIKEDHGSVENFLKEILNVDIDKLRSYYLY